MHNGDGSNLKLVRGSRGQVVDLDLPRVWRIHWQFDPVRHTRVLLPIPETGEKLKPTFTGSFILSLCLILPLFLSFLSNCHNPIELIVTTCACGTHRTFPRSIDSHVRHDSRLTKRPLSCNACLRDCAAGSPLGWAIFLGLALVGCIWGWTGYRMRER